MTVVIDTNVLLGMFRSGHPAGALLEGVERGKVSLGGDDGNPIRIRGDSWAHHRPDPRRGSLGRLGNHWAGREQSAANLASYRFRLITADADDDKFADCAITAEADYVITEDGHFDVLADAGFKVRAITLAEFIRRHLAGA
jgi:predicted nucleic acid-binding protein